MIVCTRNSDWTLIMPQRVSKVEREYRIDNNGEYVFSCDNQQMSSAFVTEHFFNPANAGDATNPDGIARAGSFICGAALQVSLGIDDSQRITEARFRSA